MLKPTLIPGRREAGCDEAGRGPLAGPVVAAAVILPDGYANPQLNDSKQLTERQRESLRAEIEQVATWAVAIVGPEEIDRLNILHASTHAMCEAVKQLPVKPDFLLIDGNRFYNETDIPYQCIVKGDAKMMSIAAASILAKTHRDKLMNDLHKEYPYYGWDSNKGYPTAAHYRAIEQHGVSPYHRRNFTLYRQHSLFDIEN